MRSTFIRTFFLIAVVVLAALLLVGASFQFLVRGLFTRQTEKELIDDCTVVAGLAAAHYSEGTLPAREFFVDLSIATQVSGADAVICDQNGKLLLCSDSPMGCEHQGMTLSKTYMERVFREGRTLDNGLIQGLYSESRYVVGMPVLNERQQPVGLVILSTPKTRTAAILDSLADTYMLVTLLVAVVAVAAITLLARQQSAPLKDMANAANAFGHGHLDARVEVARNAPREVQDLALAFNNMASSLQKSEYQRQEFVANVSHELKTPMTTISGYVDGILDGTIPPQRHRQYLQIVSDETKRLSRLVRSMLDISRLQSTGIPEENKIHFDMEEALGQVLITFEQKITSKKLNVEVDMPDHPVYTIACQDQVTQVIYNLIDNAVKFCPTGGTLSLAISEGSNKIYTSVANQGETIPGEELPLVFDRFHKMDKSRSQNRDGWGLGLYIVKTIVCSHGENISVTSRDGKTTFTFTMPLVN